MGCLLARDRECIFRHGVFFCKEIPKKDGAEFDAVKAKATYDKQLAAWKEASKKAMAEGLPASQFRTVEW